MNALGNPLDAVHIKDIRPGLKNFSITFIVLDVGPAVQLKENREVRTLKVADSTACINLSLWDEPGAAISPGDIIRLTKAYAGVWRSALTLYSGKNGDIDKIGEFCFVFNEQLNMSEPNSNFVNSVGNQPGSGMMGNVINSLNNGNSNNLGALQNRPSAQISVSQSASDRKNAPRYSGDREREPTMSSMKHSGKTGSRNGRGGQRNVLRNDNKRRRPFENIFPRLPTGSERTHTTVHVLHTSSKKFSVQHASKIRKTIPHVHTSSLAS